jgi:hypothetical protein
LQSVPWLLERGVFDTVTSALLFGSFCTDPPDPTTSMQSVYQYGKMVRQLRPYVLRVGHQIPNGVVCSVTMVLWTTRGHTLGLVCIVWQYMWLLSDHYIQGTDIPKSRHPAELVLLSVGMLDGPKKMAIGVVQLYYLAVCGWTWVIVAWVISRSPLREGSLDF